MRSVIKIGVIAMLYGSLSVAGDAPTHLYDIKSGKITYAIKGSGNIMGQTMQTVGKKRYLFDNYGIKNLSETVKVEKHSGMGGTKRTKTHTMTLMDGNRIYTVDFKNKQISKMPNVGMAMLGGGDMQQKGLAMLKQMGGKKIGTDKVLGYTCDVWELMGTKQCLYKGVTLKIESSMMGIHNTEVATDIAFDSSLSEKDFKLPDFPIQDGTSKMGAPVHAGHGGGAVAQPSAQEMAKMAEMMKAMGAAIQKSGVDTGNPHLSPQAEQRLQNAMMDVMMPQMKQEIVAQEKSIRFAKSCFQDADTLSEAKACDKKLSAMLGEEADREEELLTKWDAQTKKEILQEITQALKGVACVKQAQTAEEMQQCEQQ